MYTTPGTRRGDKENKSQLAYLNKLTTEKVLQDG